MTKNEMSVKNVNKIRIFKQKNLILFHYWDALAVWLLNNSSFDNKST